MSNRIINFINENKLVLAIIGLILICVACNICFRDKIEKMSDTNDSTDNNQNEGDGDGEGESAPSENGSDDVKKEVVDPFADKYKELVSNEDLWSIPEANEDDLVSMGKVSYQNLDNIKVMRVNRSYFDNLEKEIPSENLYLKCTIKSTKKVDGVDTYSDNQFFLGRFTLNDCQVSKDVEGGCNSKAGAPVLIPLKNALSPNNGLETHDGSKSYTAFRVTRHQEGIEKNNSKFSLNAVGVDALHNSAYLSQSSLLESGAQQVMCFDSNNNSKYCHFKLQEWGDGYLMMFMNPIKKPKKDENGKIVKDENGKVVFETDKEGNDVYEQTEGGIMLYDIYYVSACIPEVHQCNAYAGLRRLCLTVNKSAALAFKFVRFRRRNSAKCVQSCMDNSKEGIEQYRTSVLKRLFPKVQEIVSSMKTEPETVVPTNDPVDDDTVDAPADDAPADDAPDDDNNTSDNKGGVNQ